MSLELHDYDNWVMKCPRCGEYFDEEKGECPKCGWPVELSNEQRAMRKEEKEVKI